MKYRSTTQVVAAPSSGETEFRGHVKRKCRNVHKDELHERDFWIQVGVMCGQRGPGGH